MEQKLFDAAAKLPETTLVFEDIEHTPKLSKTRKLPRVFWTVAACLSLVVCISLGAFTIAAEAKEYQDALAFFAEYGLSTEGLTREEIKAIYRDITEEIYGNPKTLEVISGRDISNILGYISDLDQIGGYEILQDAPTTEQMGRAEEAFRNGTWTASPAPGIHYDYSIIERTAADQNAHSYVEMYDGHLLKWKVLIDGDFRIERIFPLADGVLVCGEDSEKNVWVGDYFTNSYHFPAIIKLSTTGQIVFRKSCTDLNMPSDIHQAISNADGSMTLFSFYRKTFDGLSSISVEKISADGKVIATGGFSINGTVGTACPLGDGYAVQVLSNSKYDFPEVVLLDEKLAAVKRFTYGTSREHYYITDMLAVNNKLYLSVYTTPKKEVAGIRNEIGGILDHLAENNISSISGEDLTPIVRDNYTAMLLVCDTETGTPEVFYSIDGSLGGKLSCSAQGVLYWNVESITSTFYSPATSSFTIGGTCDVYRYAFIGTKIVQEKTGEITIYRR